METFASRKPVLLDACAVINLFASRRMGEIVVVYGSRCEICDVVMNEAQHVREFDPGTGISELVEINLEPLFSRKILHAARPATELELETYINLVVLGLDDGEAMSGAIALHRGMVVVTDDRAATRILGEVGVNTIPALTLVRHWIEQTRQNPENARMAIEDIHRRGRYVPAHSHPLRDWWDAILSP